jgi:predicted XRE-type DNA-binding protein
MGLPVMQLYKTSGSKSTSLGQTMVPMSARILKIVQSRRLTQAAAGKALKISQPKVSALLNGRPDGFSTERLFRFLNNLGCDVQIKVSKPRPRAHGHVRMLAG